MDLRLREIIQANPISNQLDAVHFKFKSKCEEKDIPCTTAALDQLDRKELKDIVVSLVLGLMGAPASQLLDSPGSRTNLFEDLAILAASSNRANFLDNILPLLKAVLANNNDDEIWARAFDICAGTSIPTTPPRSLLSLVDVQQTPYSRNAASSVNTNELRKDMDAVIKEDLGVMYADIPGFYNAFFGEKELESVSQKVFDKCKEGPDPLFREGGWTGWPQATTETPVLSWFKAITEKLSTFAKDVKSTLSPRRKVLARPTQPITSSTGAVRKPDVSFVNYSVNGQDPEWSWGNILIPGELKSNPKDDIASKVWLELALKVREVLAYYETRRFVLGFTLCGSLLRVWNFDRLGAIGSEAIDINQDGLRFVFTILAFLCMEEEQLGFDPTIRTREDGKQIIEIQRQGAPMEQLIIEKLITRSACIVGRATTCWKAYTEESKLPLVIKDSWQYIERNNEGEMLLEISKKNVVNVARYYHHETVIINDKIDDVRGNVRRDLDITKAGKFSMEPRSSVEPLSTTSNTGAVQLHRGSSITAGKKRSASAMLPPSKRSRSDAPTEETPPNRVHRRVIIRDYGKPICEASSLPALLKALEGCIEGHKSLHEAGFLHRDISINNLIINEDEDNPSYFSFLIDLDLAIKELRPEASGAKGRTGTRAFMAIGALEGEQHSFMHDLESFFWVLFWLCIHSDGPGTRPLVSPGFEHWNYVSMRSLAQFKFATVGRGFKTQLKSHCTGYFCDLIPCMERLCEVVFPAGQPHAQQDEGLYSRMRDVLRKSREELEQLGSSAEA
ncbi:hypothetical protein VM1G_08725 [Cytospora mali]|uniref:non-specific serine/threonine protein kinase n=1 Tax=Cytospora mali TaxID=578113 RepID=A0A194WAZ5_CYTMA|nr:hypothetical protein VM1G_08725 [Valsa mali]